MPINISKKIRKLPDNCRKQHGTLNKRTRVALDLITQQGLDPRQALILASGGNEPSYNQVANVKAKIEKWSLKHLDSLRSASKTIKLFASGNEVNGIKPAHATVLAAAQRIVDASDPIIRRSENVNVIVTADPVDLSRWRR